MKTVDIDRLKTIAADLVEDGINIEYTRGICELIAEVDGIEDVSHGERACQIAKEIGVERQYRDQLYNSILLL